MKMIPVGYRILVKLQKTEQEKKMEQLGLIQAEQYKQIERKSSQIATVVTLGPDAYHDEPSKWCVPGDQVLICRYSGEGTDLSDIDKNWTYRIINDKDVLAKIQEEYNEWAES